VWRHTWRKNWVNCAVLKAIAQASELSFPVVFHTEKFAVHSVNATGSSVYLPTPRWHHLKAHPFLAIHSTDKHRTIYSFSNTTSYSTFYAFFSSFRITLWPMWRANDSLVFIHHSHTNKKTHRTDKKNDKPDGKPVLCQRTFSSVFRGSLFTQLNLWCMGPFTLSLLDERMSNEHL
jgi:hypothetical protein